MFHNNGSMLNNEKTDFIAALSKVLNHAECDLNIKKKLFKKINKILISPDSRDVHESEKEKFFLIACAVFDTYHFLVSTHFYSSADVLRESLDKFVPQVFDQNASCTPYQRYAIIRMKRRLEMLSGVMKNHEDCKSHKSLKACLENNQLTIFGQWGKLKRTVESLSENEKQDQSIIELCDVIDNDQILVPKFKLSFQSLHKKSQNVFDETHVAIANKIELLKGIFGGHECADLGSMIVPIFFQGSIPPNIEQHLKSKTYVHNNRIIVNFKYMKADDQSDSEIMLSLIDIYMANIKCFKRYGIESDAMPMVMCISDKLKRINDDNHSESELYMASLKKLVESISGSICIGADENCNEKNKITDIYAEAITVYSKKVGKLFEFDGSEVERNKFSKIFADIYCNKSKASNGSSDLLPLYLQEAVSIKLKTDRDRNSINSSAFFKCQTNKENKNPDNNVPSDNIARDTDINKRRTKSR